MLEINQKIKENFLDTKKRNFWQILTFMFVGLFLILIFVTLFIYNKYNKQKLQLSEQSIKLTNTLISNPTISPIPTQAIVNNEKQYQRLYGNLYIITNDPNSEKQSLYYRSGLDYKKLSELPIELEIDSVLKEDTQDWPRFILNTHFADVSETYLVDVKTQTIKKLELVKGYTKNETIIAFLKNNQIVISEWDDGKVTYYLSNLNDLSVKNKI